MKFFLMLVILLSSFELFAKKTTILKCLGSEELYYHKHNISNAYQKLNAKMITELIQLSKSIRLKQKFTTQLCREKYPSLELLKLIILNKSPLFYTTHSKQNIQQRSQDLTRIKEFKRLAHYVFIDFISALQVNATKPQCILNEIPELKQFFIKSRFILKQQGIIQLIKDVKNLPRVFKKLTNQKFLRKCFERNTNTST